MDEPAENIDWFIQFDRLEGEIEAEQIKAAQKEQR